jgi:acetyl-CoA carboxylase carboxyltransferase component
MRVPILTVVLRKAYDLMGSPAFDPALVVEWPLAEYGGMGLEGAAAILHSEGSAPAGVERLRDEHGARAAAGKFTVDDMIAPEETRTVLARTLSRMNARDAGPASRGIDPW